MKFWVRGLYKKLSDMCELHENLLGENHSLFWGVNELFFRTAMLIRAMYLENTWQ
jgi:hypothetical protein